MNRGLEKHAIDPQHLFVLLQDALDDRERPLGLIGLRDHPIAHAVVTGVKWTPHAWRVTLLEHEPQ